MPEIADASDAKAQADGALIDFVPSKDACEARLKRFAIENKREARYCRDYFDQVEAASLGYTKVFGVPWETDVPEIANGDLGTLLEFVDSGDATNVEATRATIERDGQLAGMVVDDSLLKMARCSSHVRGAHT